MRAIRPWRPLQALLVAALVLVPAAGREEPAGAARGQAARPNIIVFETDDQTVESLRVMPNVRRLLMRDGTTFDSSFVTYSLCCPSRATFLTGQYAHNHGVVGNLAPNGGYYKLDSRDTLPVWLQQAGYYTILLGKYLNQYGSRNRREVPPGWSEWEGTPDPSAYRYMSYLFNIDGKLVSYGRRTRDYKTDVEAARAVQLVGRRVPEAQPFFLWLTFLAPHNGGPLEPDDPTTLGTPSPAPRDRDRYADELLPTPPSFDEADVSDKPFAVRRLGRLGPRRIASLTELYQQRLESLVAVDLAIGRVVGELERYGKLDSTLLVFTSDNGFMQGEHRIPAGKVVLYEPSIRVPLIMRGPGVPRGVHVKTPVANIDLAPTIAAYAHATPARVVDGRSLVPLLRNPRSSWRRDLLIENGPGAGHFDAIRTPRYLYAEYANGDRELYDLVRDPDELDSRHNDPAYATIRDDLARRLDVLRTCAGESCRRSIPLARAARR